MVFLTSQVKINNSFLTLYSVVSLLSVIFYVKYVLVFFFCGNVLLQEIISFNLCYINWGGSCLGLGSRVNFNLQKLILGKLLIIIKWKAPHEFPFPLSGIMANQKSSSTSTCPRPLATQLNMNIESLSSTTAFHGTFYPPY